jgi:aspartyl-tRNA(Asn)/glutamyl-tRNA(Gln) amidotransferase subunit A
VDDSELCFTPALELAALIRTGRLSPVEVIEAFARRVERLNPTLNAYCTLTLEEARHAARAAQRALAAGAQTGPLFGVPFAVKDVTYTGGVRTTLGSRLYADYVPQEDAPLVERLRAAGAILLGKTTTPELGWKGVTDSPLFGISRNPWRPDRTPGGSSGGSAAAVAAGLAPLATGTDGAGSIRIPASFCGVVGFKPSFGRVPYYPPSAAELVAHAGPIARTVRDTALMLDVMAGPDDRDPHSLPASGVSYLAACERPVKGLRLAWSPDLGTAQVEAPVRRLAERAAWRFVEAGCTVEEASPAVSDPAEALETLFYAGIGARIDAQPPERQALVDPGLLRIAREFRSRSLLDMGRALAERATHWDGMRRFFERFDLLLTPTMPLPAFPVGLDWPAPAAGEHRERLAWTPFTYPFNLTGQPALTVPCGWTEEGLPVGLQIVGRRYDDATVLAAAAAFEALAPWQQRRPPEQPPRET